MSAARIMRVSVELPAGVVIRDGLADSLRGVAICDDGTIRHADGPRSWEGDMRRVLGTWAVVDEPLIP